MITYEVTPAKIRHIIGMCTESSISTTDAEKFLELFGNQITDALDGAVRQVVERHFGVAPVPK